MPDLLLELFSEEIPARMQAQAGRDLERMAGERLKAQELTFASLRTFAGPRRLTLVVEGLPTATPDREEELKGPKVGAPPQALEGFLRKAGVAREDLVEREGVLFATLKRSGRPTPEIAAEIVGEIVRGFPWPKSMRSGASSFRWVRPLKRVLFLFDGQVVPFEIDGVVAGDLTEGHRFMGTDAAKPFAVRDFAGYARELERRYVVLDPAGRRRRIVEGAAGVASAQGLEVVPDEGLLDEVTGLAEWPTPVLGAMDAAFMDLPPEVIKTSMRTHQKYFSVRRPGEVGLAPHFVVVANVEANDGGQALAAGNARVLAARLNDARFFWDEDRKPGAFDRWLEKLKGVTFHAKLGTMAERVDRIAALAREIAPAVGADPDLAERAARLAKADLASAMVGEFPELQGVMGGYYAQAAGEPEAVWQAVRDHYKPVGPSDSVPTEPVTVAVALADKLDTLVGFFAIDEKPTGSRDPFALRRAALGVIWLITESNLRLSLYSLLDSDLSSVWWQTALRHRQLKASYELVTLVDISPRRGMVVHRHEFIRGIQNAVDAGDSAAFWKSARSSFRDDRNAWLVPSDDGSTEGDILTRMPPVEIAHYFLAPLNTLVFLRSFFADRLKVQLRDEGRRHDLVDAVFALGDDDLVRIVAKVEALSGFLATEDGANLLAGYKRAANILRAEAKKNPGEVIAGDVDPARLAAPEEQALAAALRQAAAELEPALAVEDFSGAMTSLSRLRAPVDAFFEKVLVNDPDPAVRLNRLRLLTGLQTAANRVADFSLVQG